LGEVDLTYCGQQVRANDPDRFLLCLFTPGKARPAIWALFAFNHEIAKTREVVSETQLGLIRLQWWREAVNEIYEGGPVREHEVLKDLAAAIDQYDLKKEDFDTLIYAREFDLEDRVPGSMEGLMHYADFTTTPLNKMVLSVLNQSEAERIVKEVSVAYAITGLVRAVSYMRFQRRCMMPEDIMSAHGISAQKLFDFKPDKNFSKVIKEVVSGISQPDKTKIPFLKASIALSDIYLKQLKKVGFDVFDSRIQRPPAFKELRVSVKTLFS